MPENVDLIYWQNQCENARRKQAEALRVAAERATQIEILKTRIGHLEHELAKTRQLQLDLATAANIIEYPVEELP
jgi:hypothetical protein